MRQYGGTERLEAALVEMGQGMTYPATPNFEPAVLAGLERVKGRRPRRLAFPRVLTPRLALIIVVALALLAAAATAAYVGVQTWLSAGPRDVQFTSHYELLELSRDDDPRTHYQELAIGPEGKEIYAIRFLGEEEAELFDPQETAIVRMSGLQEERVQIAPVVKFSDLKDPALWHPDMGLPGIILPELVPPAAINGDLFLVASAWADTQLPEGEHHPEGPPAGSSIIVRHPDGMLQKVLTVRELVDAGLLDAAAPDRIFHRAVVASAPDHLWLQFITLEDVGPGFQKIIRRFIYEVEDPNGDGDWSDRTVVPLSLPDFVAEEQRPDCCLFMGLVAEPSLAGEDRSRSVLLLMSTTFPEREHRIYRVSDHNSDGDALDGGEFELLFSGVPASQPPPALVVAPRIVVREGKVVLRELVVSAFTTRTRVSRITETGEVIDIARAFDFILDVVADSQGNIYVWGFPPDGAPGPVLYKLKPVTEGVSGEPEAVTAMAEPTAMPTTATGAATPGAPRISFTLQDFEETEKSEIFLIGLDGSGPSKLVQGERNFLRCQSPDGSRIVYSSDEEIPNEPFIYVAKADGSDPKKVTEQPTDVYGPRPVWCLSEDSLIRVVRSGIPQTLILHDLDSGQETTLLTDVHHWVGSPDGRRIAFVTGFDYSYDGSSPPAGNESLEVLDLDTGERHPLAAPQSGISYFDFQWSPDGERVAYLVGPEEFRYSASVTDSTDFDIYVRGVSGGEAKLVYRVEGADAANQPKFTWSPSGDWLLVLVERVKRVGNPAWVERGECTEEDEHAGSCGFESEFDMILVNVASGEARQLVSAEALYFAEWAPKEDSFAYATGDAVYLASADGEVRQLATATEADCLSCLSSFGWSPDGRYIGLVRETSYSASLQPIIAVLDTTTGEVRTIFERQGDLIFIWPQWWR